jgi:hypothetical protein
MKNEFIPYEQALELKELGFDEPCIAFYEPGNKQVQVVGVEQRYNNPELLRMEDFCAPTFSQAFSWFREEYALDSYIRPNLVYDVPKTYQYNINDNIDDVWYNTYEEAELACLKKLIEIVNTKEK